VAVDVGASSGNVAYPLLSMGHEVHLFERGIDEEGGQKFLIEMTLEVNGWLDRAILHGDAVREGEGSLDAAFKDYERVDLLKIDVDDTYEYDEVFAGSLETLKKTTCIEVPSPPSPPLPPPNL